MKCGNIEATLGNIWSVAYDSGELAAAVTSLTISGLNGNIDEEYRVIIRGVQGNSGDIFIRLNGDSTIANYGMQSLRGYGGGSIQSYRDAGVSYAGFNTVFSSAASSAGDIALSDTLIHAKSGYVRTALTRYMEWGNGTTINGVGIIGWAWNNTSDNITSMVIASSASSGLGVGTRIILLKKSVVSSGMRVGILNVQGNIKGTWQKIYSNILSSAATSITISGLNGNGDALYRLITRHVNGYSGSSGTLMSFNNDTTNSHYGYQFIGGSNSTVWAGRDTSDRYYIVSNDTALNDISFSDSLIYAKSGKGRLMLSDFSYKNVGTTVNVSQHLGSIWNNTADNLTSIEFTNNHTNGIGAGTVIELWRLNL